MLGCQGKTTCFPNFIAWYLEGNVVTIFSIIGLKNTHGWFTVNVNMVSFCKFCFTFAPDIAGGSRLGMLVKTPYTGATNFSNPGILADHGNKTYHKTAAIAVSNFLDTCRGGTVLDRISIESQAREAAKRNFLKTIVETIHFCGIQAIALRGHRDAGVLTSVSDFQTKENEGNLRALLRLQAGSGNTSISQYVNKCPKNATYLSTRIQNELIKEIGDAIRDHVLKEIFEAKFFSILVDETTDVSNKEQLSLTIRYTHDSVDGKMVVKEEFMGFFHATELTGEGLSIQILEILSIWGLDPCNLRGQGYDGGSNMAGKFKGVQARISQHHPLAIYVHCACHSLNLALSDASDLRPIRRALATMKDDIVFFKRKC